MIDFALPLSHLAAYLRFVPKFLLLLVDLFLIYMHR